MRLGSSTAIPLKESHPRRADLQEIGAPREPAGAKGDEKLELGMDIHGHILSQNDVTRGF